MARGAQHCVGLWPRQSAMDVLSPCVSNTMLGAEGQDPCVEFHPQGKYLTDPIFSTVEVHIHSTHSAPTRAHVAPQAAAATHERERVVVGQQHAREREHARLQGGHGQGGGLALIQRVRVAQHEAAEEVGGGPAGEGGVCGGGRVQGKGAWWRLHP